MYVENLEHTIIAIMDDMATGFYDQWEIDNVICGIAKMYAHTHNAQCNINDTFIMNVICALYDMVNVYEMYH